MGTIITHFHTHYSIYTDTLGTWYTVRLRLSGSFSHKIPASSLAAPAAEFAMIHPHNTRSITFVSSHHLCSHLLAHLLLSFLNPYTSCCFNFFHTNIASTLSSHLLSFSFPAIFHPIFFRIFFSSSAIQSCFSTIPCFNFVSVSSYKCSAWWAGLASLWEGKARQAWKRKNYTTGF